MKHQADYHRFANQSIIVEHIQHMNNIMRNTVDICENTGFILLHFFFAVNQRNTVALWSALFQLKENFMCVTKLFGNYEQICDHTRIFHNKTKQLWICLCAAFFYLIGCATHHFSFRFNYHCGNIWTEGMLPKYFFLSLSIKINDNNQNSCKI